MNYIILLHLYTEKETRAELSIQMNSDFKMNLLLASYDVEVQGIQSITEALVKICIKKESEMGLQQKLSGRGKEMERSRVYCI